MLYSRILVTKLKEEVQTINETSKLVEVHD